MEKTSPFMIMNSILLRLCAVCATSVLAVNFSYAQTARIQNQIISQRNAPPTAGRDFWFGIPSNQWGQGSSLFLRLYITSQTNTTAFVAVGNAGGQPVSITANRMSIFNIPISWELQTSGEPEQAVHVWSNDADLTVYFMNHAAETADGTFVIPTLGWGTDYVVAGYASLYDGNGDYPSEFTIAASDKDSTTVQITPACDLRQGSNPNSVGYHAGQTYNVTLGRGEAMQFLSVQAQDVQGYDVTGTIIHSSAPIGVIGGSMCTNIPLEYPYCDHVEHMMPPVRTWATTYYSTYFSAPAKQTGHDFGDYIFISSKAGQTIWGYNLQQGKYLVTTIPNQYGTYENEYEKAQKFWSDAPFMLVEYMNGSSYPTNFNGYGDPAEVVINPREHYTKTVVFETPAQSAGLQSYNSFASVIVNVNDTNRTTFDGRSISQYNSRMQPIDDTFEVFSVPVNSGAHIVTGDSAGVGINVYGYGFDESYAWSGALGLSIFNSPDTLAPKVTITGACYQSFVHLADSGYLPKTSIEQSGIASIQFDSSSNMNFSLDPNWVEGAGVDTGGYSLSVIDPTKPAYLSAEVFDQAGNRTSVVSSYSQPIISIEPALLDFGSDTSQDSIYRYVTITDSGTAPFNLKELSLTSGKRGFAIDSGAAVTPIAPGEPHVLKIVYKPIGAATAKDTLILGDGCFTASAALIARGSVADFHVTDQQWLNEPLPAPPNGYVKTVTIENLSNIPITIDSVWWGDTVHFKAVSSLPTTLPALGNVPFDIAYFPDDSSAIAPNRTQGSWWSLGNAVRTDSLVGSAASAAVGTVPVDRSEITLYPNPTTGIVAILGAIGAVQVTNVLGERVMPAIPSVQRKGALNIDLSQLPAGTYFVRVTEAGGQSTVVKVVKQGD